MKTGRGTRAMLALALAAGMGVGLEPASAATIVTGSITQSYPGISTYPAPETLAYIAQGCSGHHSDGIYQAVIDVRAHRGQNLRLFDAGADMTFATRTVIPAFFSGCQPQIHGPVGRPAMTGQPLTFRATGDYLVLAIGSPGVVNQRYRLDVL